MVKLLVIFLLGSNLIPVDANSAVKESVIEDFENISNWIPIKSEGVELKLTSSQGIKGRSLILDFDFFLQKVMLLPLKRNQ